MVRLFLPPFVKDQQHGPRRRLDEKRTARGDVAWCKGASGGLQVHVPPLFTTGHFTNATGTTGPTEVSRDIEPPSGGRVPGHFWCRLLLSMPTSPAPDRGFEQNLAKAVLSMEPEVLG